MQTDYSLQSAVALWAFALGCFLCLVYDVLRIFRSGRNQNPILLFLLDAVFCLFASASFSVLFFNLSFGRMRGYAFVFGGLGFIAWRFTVSRLFMMLMLKFRDMLLGFLNSVKFGVMRLCKGLFRRVYTKVYCRKAVIRARRGFGIYKKIRKEN